MKQCMFKVSAFLVLGTILNIALAISAAELRGPGLVQQIDQCESRAKREVIRAWIMWEREITFTQSFDLPAVTFVVTAQRRETESQLTMGWPLISIGRTWDARPSRLAEDKTWTMIWPGFAINSLFYAGILWLLFAAPFALRRRRRIKRGLCPACAYPVGDSEVCTECGKPVAVQSGKLAA
jgi:hypothetical protein